MARKLIERSPEIIEKIMEECLREVGITDLEENKVKLLLRLIISGIGNHYFKNPDDLIRVGFIQFCKSPDKDELFKVCIIRDRNEDIINANALWRYYNGDLYREKSLKKSLEFFLADLIKYAQQQEIEITKSISKIEKRKEKKED